jgi:hypothetical protein
VVLGRTVAAGKGPRLTAATFAAAGHPGLVKAAINFRVTPASTGCVVSTETRVWAADSAARRRFAAYWRVIYPGSAWIRRAWLQAIRQRAERGS